jgi:hypothetical protein
MGGRLHVHEREDETWFILEVEYSFQVGGQTISAHAVDYAFGPRNVPRGHANRRACCKNIDHGRLPPVLKDSGANARASLPMSLRTWRWA